LVDWSDNDSIGVGLQSSLYIWSGCTSKVRKIYESENPTDYLCSVSFLRHNSKVSVGFTDGSVKIFDLCKTRKSLQFDGLHFGRVGSLGCSHNIICTGGRDGFVSIQDYRQEK
jgi:prepilin-type processing-associated H-X9-DG protein